FFLYPATRRLLGWEGRGDTGAFIRSTIRALRLFGVPPEEYWPYNEKDFDREPQAFQYAFAQNFRAIQYFRIEEQIGQLKSALDSGLPFAFGFTCFTSMFTPQVKASGVIPYPTSKESVEGGHAVLAVGYTDSHVLIRNSWGEEWGVAGYGFLPWTFFDRSRPLATDCWALVNASIVPPEEVTLEPAGQGMGHKRSSGADVRQQPLIQVVRGSDPHAEVPIRITQAGVKPVHDGLEIGLRSTQEDISVKLRGVSITPSFDFTLLGQASDELYLLGLAWDLSAQPPRLIAPADPATASEQLKGVFQQKAAGGEIRFGDGGLQVWKEAPVVGALYLNLLLVESTRGPEELGKALRDVQELVKKSDLIPALGRLGSGVSAETLVQTEEAARLLLGEVTGALEQQGHVIPLFEGVYGANAFLQGQTDVYDQLGVVIELDRTIKDEARGDTGHRLTALQKMQLAMVEERQRGSSKGTTESTADVTPAKAEEPTAPRRRTGPHA
ncbi:C1 family peptidase, partial [Corallococcus llansteffanensis]